MLSRKKRISLICILSLILFSVVLMTIPNLLVQYPSVRGFLLRKLSETTGYDLNSEKMKISIWDDIEIKVYDLVAKSTVSTETFVSPEVRISLDMEQLVKGIFVPATVFIDQPRFEVALENGLLPMKGGDDVLLKKIVANCLKRLRSAVLVQGLVYITNLPFRFENIDCKVSQKCIDPARLQVDLKGHVVFREEGFPFALSGAVTENVEDPGNPISDITVAAKKIPLGLIPGFSASTEEEGHGEVKFHISGTSDGPLSADGNITIEKCLFLPPSGNAEWAVSLMPLNIGIKMVYADAVLQVPCLEVIAPDFSLQGSSEIDFRERLNPHVSLLFASDQIPLAAIGRILPKALLSDVKVQACKAEEALSFTDVSGKLTIKNSDLILSDVSACFGHSKLNRAEMEIKRLFLEPSVSRVGMNGTFDIRDIFRQKDMGLIPEPIARQFSTIQSVSGSLKTDIRIDFAQDFQHSPEIHVNGEIEAKDISLAMDGLPANIRDCWFLIQFYGNTDFHLKLTAPKGQWKKIKFDHFEADCDFRSGDFYIENFKLRAPHGNITAKGHIKRRDDPENVFSVFVKMRKQSVSDLLYSLGLEQPYLEGLLTLEVSFFMNGQNAEDLISNLSGNMTVLLEKGTDQKIPYNDRCVGFP